MDHHQPANRYRVVNAGHLVQKDTMRDCIEGFSEIQKDDPCKKT